MLLEEFIQPHGLSLAETARLLQISYPRLHEVVRGKRGVTTDTALRLEALFGMDADFWLNLQRNFDLWHARNSPLAKELESIPSLAHA
jgi:addiction module HigA family antidote